MLCVSRLTSLVLSLEREGEERSDAKAIGLANLVKEYRFVCTMLLLCDVLPHISILSKPFQVMDCDYSMISHILGSTLTTLNQLKTVDGSNLSGVDNYIAELSSKGIELKQRGNLGPDYFRKSVLEPYLNNLIQNVTRRFEDKSLMCLFQIFDPAALPTDPTDLQHPRK